LAILFDRNFGRVWTDGTTPCVFAQVVSVPQQEELDELADKQLALIRELKRNFGEVYSILDLRFCPLVPAHIIQHYVANVVPLQFDVGLTHKAFVAPEEKKSYEVLVKAFLSITDLSISMHTSFENALNKINQKRTQVKSMAKKKSIFSFFYKD
jgi:hypothetical protein